MKKILIASAAAVVLCGASAFAADMPVKAAAAPMFNWSGFYAGINGGYGWENDPGFTLTNPPTTVGAPAIKSNGGFGGGQIGVNWQAHGSALVLGLEADIQAADIKGSYSQIIDGAGDNLAASKKLDYFGTVRGRAGFAVDSMGRLLIYGTGGLAYGQIKERFLVTNAGVASSADLNTSTTRAGAALGGGFEYALGNAWSVRAEYLYLMFSKSTLSAPVVPGGGGTITSSSLDNNYQVVRVALDYKY
jgi:outer membrane immunogenic protein